MIYIICSIMWSFAVWYIAEGQGYTNGLAEISNEVEKRVEKEREKIRMSWYVEYHKVENEMWYHKNLANLYHSWFEKQDQKLERIKMIAIKRTGQKDFINYQEILQIIEEGLDDATK